MLSDIRQKANAAQHAQVKQAVRGSLYPGKLFDRVRTPEYTAVLCRQAAVDLAAVIAGHHKNIREEKNVLKFQNKTQVSIVRDCCVKAYKKSRILTAPYALRSWKGLLTLYFYGLPVADPIACVIFRDGSSMLITKAFSLPTLDKSLFHEYRGFSSGIRHALAARLGETIGCMHARGIYHADLKACNILVDQSAAQFIITDTDRVVLYNNLSQSKRTKNLLQINLSIPKQVSRAVRLRFLKAYAKETRDDANLLFSKIWKLSRGKEIVYTTGSGDKFERWEE